MRNCPHATGVCACDALRSSGFARTSVSVPENWWNKYCVSGRYSQCPNLNAAQDMKEERRRSTGARLGEKENSKAAPNLNALKFKQTKNNKTTAVHSHGGEAPHFCEKPWRSSGLRFRIIRSLFYLKPWK